MYKEAIKKLTGWIREGAKARPQMQGREFGWQGVDGHSVLCSCVLGAMREGFSGIHPTQVNEALQLPSYKVVLFAAGFGDETIYWPQIEVALLNGGSRRMDIDDAMVQMNDGLEMTREAIADALDKWADTIEE